MGCIIKDKDIQKSESPIKCYEIVLKRYPRRNRYSGSVYSFPYKGGNIDESIINGNRVMEDNDDVLIDQTDSGKRVIRNGLIHSYRNYEDAFVVSTNMGTSVIYECEIPDGTPYYNVIEFDGFDGYMSKSVKFIKRI